MVTARIFCHADIQALQNRLDQQFMFVELVSLESVRVARDSCVLLLNLIQGRDSQYPKKVVKLTDRSYWRYSQMDLLSLIAGVALELLKIKHDLYPRLVSQEAKLEEGGFLKDLLLLKNSAVTLVRLAKDAKKIVGRVEPDDKEDVDEEDVEPDDEEEEDVLAHVLDVLLLRKVKEFGQVVEDTAYLVLKGTHNIAWLQARLPSVLDPVDRLLSTTVLFPGSG